MNNWDEDLFRAKQLRTTETRRTTEVVVAHHPHKNYYRDLLQFPCGFRVLRVSVVSLCI